MSVASKNLFDLLGEDGETPAVKAPQKPAPASADARPAQGNRRGQTGNEAAFRDRNAGSTQNRSKGTEEGTRGGGRGGYGARVRGGRGSRHPRDRDDRHSKNFAPGSEKQAAQSWGAAEGKAELKDEEAGAEIAKKEQKEGGEGKEAEAEAEAEEEKMVSYETYLAQLAEKKLALDSPQQVRQANEGTKSDKKWAGAKPLVKDEDDEFISASGSGKARRERERKVKTVIDVDPRFVEPERSGRGGGRGGRGGSRGGAPRGDRGAPRGDRGGPRGGAPRGAPRGGAPRGSGPKGAAINTSDQQAFPSLGK